MFYSANNSSRHQLYNITENIPQIKNPVCALQLWVEGLRLAFNRKRRVGGQRYEGRNTRRQLMNCKALTAALVTNQMNTESKSENALSLSVLNYGMDTHLTKQRKYYKTNFPLTKSDTKSDTLMASWNQLDLLKHHS